MKQNLRPIHEQVVVITGASSGLGRETALQFGERGASVVLAARNEEALQEVKQQIERIGGKAHVVVTDVSEWSQVERLASEAVERFGRIDTWVNNAAASMYATVEQMTPEEIDRIIQVILMGQIYGMKAALPHLKRQGRGAIINVASALAERSVPLQSAYCAAKHGIKGFTESLRLELEHEKSGISVTLILPSSMNTPLFNQARSKMGVKPQPIPPIYEPQVVAETILFAAEHPRRDIVAGGAGKFMTVMERLSPRLLDKYMLQGNRAFTQQKTNQPSNHRDNLFEPLEGPGSTTGDFGNKATSSSPYTRHLEQYPNRKRALVTLVLIGAGLLLSSAGRKPDRQGSSEDERHRMHLEYQDEYPAPVGR
jgi:NAD(P)-dependent dehydrogenase (short-subunit alcohol dehydrogenase family)